MNSFERARAVLLTSALAASAWIGGCGEPAGQAEALLGGSGSPGSAHAESGTTMPDHLVNPPADPRAALNEALEAGLFDNDEPVNTKLRAALKVAGVAEASQVLVFSKTSLQDRLISPTRPRAIYFNDECYIGYVPGGLIEYGDADPDPAVGTGLFAIDPHAGPDAKLFTDNGCLSCHGGSRTNSRPGFLVRSVFPDHAGFPITSAGSQIVGHDTPIEKRWGGWYVTGKHGSLRHLGNLTADENKYGDAEYDTEPGANLTDLSRFFNTERYLVETSDIVALMVLEHQVQMHNKLTQGAAVVREQTERSRSLAEYLKEDFDPQAADTLQRVIASQAGKIVKHLLYYEEAALAEPVVGNSAYQQAFRANRKEDDAGRSLKDFDLQTRMFKYRCSYMVYARAFETMPDLLKDKVIDELRIALADQSEHTASAHLDAEERRAIRTILSQTTDWF